MLQERKRKKEKKNIHLPSVIVYWNTFMVEGENAKAEVKEEIIKKSVSHWDSNNTVLNQDQMKKM